MLWTTGRDPLFRQALANCLSLLKGCNFDDGSSNRLSRSAVGCHARNEAAFRSREEAAITPRTGRGMILLHE